MIRSLMISELEILDIDLVEKNTWEKKIEDYGYVITKVLDTLVILGTDPTDYCVKVDNVDNRQSISALGTTLSI